MDSETDLTAGGGIFSLLLALVVYWVAARYGFFKLPPPSFHTPVNFKQTLGVFLLYLLFSLVLLPTLLVIAVLIATGEFAGLKNLSELWLGWTQAIALWVIALLLMLYCFCIRRETRRFIFWGEQEPSKGRFWSEIGLGMVTYAISYPFVLLVSIVTKALTLLFWGKITFEQAAVKQLELVMGRPILFSLMLVAVVFVVPFAEELLFRGFLQNFFKRHFGRKWAIALSSLIFASAHFAKSQGAGNFQLICTLGVLAFFLGFIYERQRSLWASYGLHMTFNGINVFLMILSNN